MEKDDLSKLQRSRRLRTKYSEGKKWRESLSGSERESRRSSDGGEDIMQPNIVESAYETELSTLIWK